MIQVKERHETLVCMEVWGGNRSVTRSIQLPDLTFKEVTVYDR